MGNYTKAIETYREHPVKEDTFEFIARYYVALSNYDVTLVNYDCALNIEEENPKNMQAQFFMLTTKSAYYQDMDEKIQLHEEFINKFPEGWHTKHVKQLLVILKEEKFMQKE